MKSKIVLVMLSVLLISGIIGVFKISSADADTNKPTSKYEKPSVQDITGLGDSPYEISSKASANAVEKQWYEYILYSNQPVGETELDLNTKLVFYDPYSYRNSTIMDLKGTEEEWSSANTITRSYTTSDSETWSDSTTKTETESITGTNADGIIHTKYEDSKIGPREGKKWEDIQKSESGSIEVSLGADFSILSIPIVEGGIKSSNGKTNTTTEIADRFSRQFGISKNEGHSETEGSSTTVTRSFNATYFNQYGSPLQWKVIMYEVFLPIKVDMQKKVDGEWFVVDSAYCKYKIMDGYSRSYIKDNKTYAEDWGTGEPILWSDFENSFFSEEKLIEAYKNNLYPNN